MYGANIELTLPESTHNRNLGNAIVSLSLLSVPSPSTSNTTTNLLDEDSIWHYVLSNNQILTNSQRIVMMAYKSRWQRFLNTLWKTLTVFFHFDYESQVVTVGMTDNIIQQNVPSPHLSFSSILI